MPGATPYVLVEERSVGGNVSKGRRIFGLVLNIAALVLSAGLFICGILSLIASHTHSFEGDLHYDGDRGVKFHKETANFSIRVLSGYFLILSLLFIAIELKSTTVLTAFAGMISPLGRGVIYLIVGLLVFGTVGNFGIIFGLLWMILAVAHIVYGARNCTQFYDEGSVDNGSATVTRSTPSSSSYVADSGAEKNFCRSCGAALRPSDSYCPDCSAAV